MDLIRTVTPHVTGVSEALGGSGDPSPATALGVLWAMQAVAERLWGGSPPGRHVCISGVGKVGAALADHLHAEGARLTVADIADRGGRRRWPLDTGATVVAPERAHTVRLRHLLALRARRVPVEPPRSRSCGAPAVVGSANNQLATAQDAQRIHDPVCCTRPTTW